MSARHTLKVLAALFCLVPASAALAQKLDKEDKKWVEEVRPLMLVEEEKTYRELKDKSEREEFKKIFWARRDPDLRTPENEFEAAYKAARAEADAQYKVDRPGSETDCGRVFLLLGKPDEVKQEDTDIGAAPALRKAETWTYKDRPDQRIVGGQAQIRFEANCTLPQGDRMAESLVKVAEAKIKNPNLGYKKGADGKLVRLLDQLPKPSPTQTLLKSPRQDFPLTVERKLLTRLPQGGTYVAFLVHAPKDAVNASKVVVTGLATDAAGAVTAVPDREIVGSASADGSFTGSIGLTLRPGKYDVQIALLDPASSKGSVANAPVEVIDEASSEVAVSTVVLKDIQQGTTPKPTDPYAAFSFGDTIFVPQPGNAYSPADSLTLIAFLYGGAKDATTGKTAVALSMTLTKDGTPVARMAEEKFETPASPSIGPIPLATYAPGTYVADVKVRDEVAKKDYSEKVTFEVRK